MIHSINKKAGSNPRRKILFENLVRSAGRIYAIYGFKRTQIIDIAQEAGVAIGTVYSYAEGKVALFDLAVRSGFRETIDPPAGWPVSDPAKSDTEQAVRRLIRQATKFEAFEKAMQSPAPEPGAAARAEIEAILAEVYDRIADLSTGIRIVDRSAREWPELAEMFIHEVRTPLIERLTGWLESRSDAGSITGLPDAAASSRFVLESCAWMAMHRRFDLAASDFSDRDSRLATLSLLRRAIHPGDM